MKFITTYSGMIFSCMSLTVMIFFQLNQVQADSVTQNQQIIVQFTQRNDLEPKADDFAQIEARLVKWRRQWGVEFSFVRYFGENGWIVAIPERLEPVRMHAILARLNREPAIRYAEIDVTVKLIPPEGGFDGGLAQGLNWKKPIETRSKYLRFNVLGETSSAEKSGGRHMVIYKM